MNSPQPGRVASLHLHPTEPGAPLIAVESIEVVEQKGIFGEPRYFGRMSGNGEPGRRQVSLIEREQIAEHAIALGLQSIPPGVVRANIETTGINLVASVGDQIRIGEAVLFIAAPRDPCEKMDRVCRGLRELMAHNRQGVLAQVIHSGTVRVGDEIRIMPAKSD